jgi:hypothetical protein
LKAPEKVDGKSERMKGIKEVSDELANEINNDE